MNLRCIYCQTPFTLSRTEMLGAIISMTEKSQNHYDAHCPRCRRANSISRQRMELFFPNWQEAAKQQASAPIDAPPTLASASLKTEPVSKTMKEAFVQKVEARKAAAKASSAASKPASAAKKKPAATSSAKGKKTTASKPVTKKAPTKGKKK
jgi:hypothetical protein